MKLTVVGCSGRSRGRSRQHPHTSSKLTDSGVLSDLATAPFGAPVQTYVSPADVDAIGRHPPACRPLHHLTAYIVSLRYGGAGHRGTRRIPLIGPPALHDRWRPHMTPQARNLGLPELFDFAVALLANSGPSRWTSAGMNHRLRSAVKMTHNDRSLVYSADTGESSSSSNSLAAQTCFSAKHRSVGPTSSTRLHSPVPAGEHRGEGRR